MSNTRTMKPNSTKQNCMDALLPAEVVLNDMDITLWGSARRLAEITGVVMAACVNDEMNDAYGAILRKCFNDAGHAFLRRGEHFNDAIAWHLIAESRVAANLMGDLGLLTAFQEVANERQPVLKSPDLSDPVWVLMNFMLNIRRQTHAAVAVAGSAVGEEYAQAVVNTGNEFFEWLDGRLVHKGIKPLVFEVLYQVEHSVSMMLESGYDISME